VAARSSGIRAPGPRSLPALLADRVLVMYLGRIVKMGPVNHVFERPRHPMPMLRSFGDEHAAACHLA
jgi:ABC-type glutathione transport system ATPase component